MQNDFLEYKAEERGIAVATSIDDNAVIGKSDKYIWYLICIRYTIILTKNTVPAAPSATTKSPFLK